MKSQSIGKVGLLIITKIVLKAEARQKNTGRCLNLEKEAKMKKYDPICSSGGPNDHDPKMQEIRTGEYLKVNDVKAAVICKMFDLKAALVSNDIIEAFKIITEFKYDINKL